MLIFRLLAMVIAMSVLAVFAMPVFAQHYSPGVTEGRFVKYGHFVGVGPGFELFNDYDWLKMEVVSVSGNEVTLLSTGQYKNGDAIPGNGTISIWNVETGTENGNPSTQGPIIAANLAQGDAIPPPNTYTVNKTEEQTYLGVSRSVNILDVTVSTPDYDTKLTYIYDKASGMLLESTSKTTQTQPESTTSEYSYSIIETNIFESASGNLPTEYIIIIGVTVVIVILVALAIIRKTTKNA